MAKFVIECPSCGKFAEAKTGFFARKKIDCSCGYTINVRTDKLTGRECPHCGNMVVFDQSRGEKAKCPVCGEPINTAAERSKMEEFSCGQCGVRLRANRAAGTYTCPVCDFVNDVPERLMAEKIKKDGLASVIKYEGDNETLVWKHPIEDFNMGSQLIVHESQEALFFRDGQALDLFGPGRYTLETQQLPLMEKLYQLPTDTEGTFHAEVYFINKTVQMSIKWGTPDKVRFIDPLTSTPLESGVIGMTKEAMSPMFSQQPPAPAAPAAPSPDGWDCSCGQKGVTGKFCPECGAPRPVPADTWDCGCGKRGIASKFCPECGAPRPALADTWDCSCGQKAITSKFCPECGAKRPEAPAAWNCPGCGQTGITGKFCPECGTKRPEPAPAWDCTCGAKGITGKFCPECGSKRGE